MTPSSHCSKKVGMIKCGVTLHHQQTSVASGLDSTQPSPLATLAEPSKGQRRHQA